MCIRDRIIPVEEVLEKIESVTEDDIQSVAMDLFIREKLSLAAVGPFRGEDEMMRVVDSSML